MTARSYKMIVALAAALVFCTLSGNAMAQGKGEALAVDDVQVAGDSVLVTVTNNSDSPKSGKVSVTATVGGFVPCKSAAIVAVHPGASIQVPVNFPASVSSVIVVGISETANPLG